MLLRDKVAVITGIGPGMGKEIALLFARHGAKLAIGARSAQTTEETAAEIRAMGGEVVTAVVDLSKEATCRAIVDQAATVAEAFGTMSHRVPDVIVSDIGLPDEDGYSLIRRLRARGHGDQTRLPAIALTAYARPPDAEAAIKAGYDRYLRKPVVPSELVRAIKVMAARA